MGGPSSSLPPWFPDLPPFHIEVEDAHITLTPTFSETHNPPTSPRKEGRPRFNLNLTGQGVHDEQDFSDIEKYLTDNPPEHTMAEATVSRTVASVEQPKAVEGEVPKKAEGKERRFTKQEKKKKPMIPQQTLRRSRRIATVGSGHSGLGMIPESSSDDSDDPPFVEKSIAESDDNSLELSGPKGSAVSKKRKSHSAPKPPTDPSDAVQFRKILTERSFHSTLVQNYPRIRDHLEFHQWENMIPLPLPVNESIVREFYVALWASDGDVITVRGVPVTCSSNVINQLLGLTPPKNCCFQWFMTQGTTAVEDLEIERLLALPGKGWIEDHNRSIIRSGNLDFAPSLWFQFVRHNISATAHDATLPRERCLLLYCILQNMPINVGPICRTMLDDVPATGHKNLLFPGLITRMCSFFNVPEYRSDKIWHSTSQIDQGTIRRLLIRCLDFHTQIVPIPRASRNRRRPKRPRPTTARPPTPPRGQPRIPPMGTHVRVTRPEDITASAADGPPENTVPWQQALMNHMATQTASLSQIHKKLSAMASRLQRLEEIFSFEDDNAGVEDAGSASEDDVSDHDADLSAGDT